MRWEVGLGRCFRARGSNRIWVCSCGDPKSCTQRLGAAKLDSWACESLRTNEWSSPFGFPRTSLWETHNTSGGPSPADPGESLPVSPKPTLSPYNSGTPFPKQLLPVSREEPSLQVLTGDSISPFLVQK